MKILTDKERTQLLAKLAEAPDDILLEAVARMKEYYVNVKDDMKALNGFVGIHFTEAPKIALPTEPIKAPTLKADAEPDAPKNVEPPGPSAQRITSASKDAIMQKLRVKGTADEVNKFLGRGPGKIPETQMLLRRLWELGLIGFDGTHYKVT